jgi:L-fuculose-phosphate aldolase
MIFRFSISDGRELLAITPSSRYYDTLETNDIQILDFNMEAVAGTLPPSIETPLHIGIYQARSDVNAIVHTHSAFACAVAVTGTDIPPIMEDQVAVIGGEIKTAGPEAKNITEALGERNAVLLANHGGVSVGRNMHEAFTVCELLEKTAKIYYLASSLGRINILPSKAKKACKKSEAGLTKDY